MFSNSKPLFIQAVITIGGAFSKRSLFSGSDNCAKLPGMWFVIYIAVTTAEIYQCSHSLSSFRKLSAYVDKYQWVQSFRMNEFNDTPLLRMHLYVRCHFSRLISVTRHKRIIRYLEGMFYFNYQTTNIHFWHRPTT